MASACRGSSAASPRSSPLSCEGLRSGECLPLAPGGAQRSREAFSLLTLLLVLPTSKMLSLGGRNVRRRCSLLPELRRSARRQHRATHPARLPGGNREAGCSLGRLALGCAETCGGVAKVRLRVGAGSGRVLQHCGHKYSCSIPAGGLPGLSPLKMSATTAEKSLCGDLSFFPFFPPLLQCGFQINFSLALAYLFTAE